MLFPSWKSFLSPIADYLRAVRHSFKARVPRGCPLRGVRVIQEQSDLNAETVYTRPVITIA